MVHTKYPRREGWIYFAGCTRLNLLCMVHTKFPHREGWINFAECTQNTNIRKAITGTTSSHLPLTSHSVPHALPGIVNIQSIAYLGYKFLSWHEHSAWFWPPKNSKWSDKVNLQSALPFVTPCYKQRAHRDWDNLYKDGTVKCRTAKTSNSLTSAGTRSPMSSTMMSPGTNSCARKVSTCPLRMLEAEIVIHIC